MFQEEKRMIMSSTPAESGADGAYYARQAGSSTGNENRKTTDPV